MKKMNITIFKRAALMLTLAILIMSLVGCEFDLSVIEKFGIKEVPSDEEYTFTNPEPELAKTDAGFKIDGIADEEAYKNANWLYLSNNGEGNNVNIAATSHFGQQGMYFVFDVTESFPIYVNPDRGTVLNSGIEMYLAPAGTKNDRENNFFEIDLQPTGNMVFKMTNGRWGYVDAKTTNDKMARLGATTKGGEVNTTDCYGYVLELFIPWDYMEWLGVDVAKMKDHALVNIAHITSFNYDGKNHNIDRYWYSFGDQIGAAFSDVYRYYKFDKDGAVGTVPVKFTNGDHYSISGQASVLSGKSATITVTPEAGYSITSLLVDGKERIGDAKYNSDGSATLTINNVTKEVIVSAIAEVMKEGKSTLSGQLQLKNALFADSLEGVTFTCNGSPITIDENGNFELKDMTPGYYELCAEKSGYTSVTHGVYLNNDTKVDVELEYNLFYYNDNNAKNWVLDDQNEGILYKNPGRACVLTNDSFGDFTFEMTLKYDTELANSGTTADHKEQRMGMRIVFADGKEWYINVLYQDGAYRLQYASMNSNSLFEKWPTKYGLNVGQIEKLKSEEGIQMKVVRQGNVVKIYIDGFAAVKETLNEEYTDMTAQLGMDCWTPNETPIEIPFSISVAIAE